MQTVVRTLLRATVYQLVRRLGLKSAVLLGAFAFVLLVSVEGAWAAITERTLYPTQTPDATQGGSNSFELGTRFQVVGQTGEVVRVRFYKPSGHASSSHDFTVWSSTDVALATCTTSSETASGWQSCELDTPLALSADTNYRVSVSIIADTYAYKTGGWSSGRSDGPLASSGTNGLYSDTPGDPPDQSAPASTDYFVDAVVATDDGEPEPTGVTDAQMTWWGVWALVGLWFVGVIAPPMLSAMRVTRGMGA